jgi:predicted MFS family arabinose efflux permease
MELDLNGRPARTYGRFMTAMTSAATPTLVGRHASILSPALVRVFVASAGSLTSFYLLLSVVPLFATSVGAGAAGAGIATGVLMFATVGTEFVTPRLVERFGYRVVLATGLVLLGGPALLLPLATSMPEILAVSIVRGIGFAIVVVLGGALVAMIVPSGRRGEALGLSGIVCGVPGVVALPLGAWLAGHIGYAGVFVIGGLAALAGLIAVPGLPGRSAAADEPRILDGLGNRAMRRPALAFGGTAVAGGIVVAFLPLAVSGAAGGLVATALLAQSAAATLARWWAGRRADRHGAGGLLGPAVLLSAAGMLLLALTAVPVAVLAGALVFGAGFGMAQNASLALMFDSVSRSGYGLASALWNMAFDGGYGLGAAGCGLVAGAAGYPIAFALTAAVVFSAVLPARRR